MARAKKQRRRRDWEDDIWSALIDFANAGRDFRKLVRLCLEWINGDIDDLELCRDIKAGSALDELAARYRDDMRLVLAWLSLPNGGAGAKACRFLMEHGNSITMSWTETNFRPGDNTADSMLIHEWPESIGSVVAPVCRFIKDQVDRHDLNGEPLREAIPVTMCGRPGCGRFRLIRRDRPGIVFCSNVCKASYHQSLKTNRQKADYMRQYRAGLDRQKPKTGRLVVRRGKKTGGARRGNL